jgi:hypothetical protein
MSATVDRLTVEAGKYHGLTAGETIDRREVVLQAEANGYSDREARAMLEDKGQEIEIPEQGRAFGDLWPGNQSRGTLCADSPSGSALDRFTDYCSDNTYEWQGIDRYNHTFNTDTGRKRFVRAKNVDRYFNKEYDTYSTVLITYCADDAETDIARQAKSFHPRAVVRKRRQILKDLGVYDSYAGVTVLAPKYQSDTTLCAVTPSTHAHSFLWIPGTVSPDDFRPLIEAHVSHVDGATESQHGDGSITVRHWGPQYCEPLPQGPDDVKRGETSSAPYEVAANLPWLKHPHADYVEEWSAAMWQGEDSQTVARWKPMGKPSHFKEVADRMDTFTRLREGAFAADAISGTLCPDTPSDSGQPDSSPRTIPKPAQDALVKAVAQFARMPDLPRPYGAIVKLQKSAG